MKQKDYLKLFEIECREELALTRAKNADYADDSDALKNFRLVEILSSGRITMEDAIFVRMSDKFQRIVNLMGRKGKVKDEAVTDTLRDLSVYAKILKILLSTKNNG